MSEQPGVDAEFYVAVLRAELAQVNNERLMLRALLDQATAQLTALAGEHAAVIAELEQWQAAASDDGGSPGQ